MKRTFHYQDEKSNKFWSIEVSETSFTVNFGKEGAKGQFQTKTFDTGGAAQKEADKLIAEKIKKGYTEEADPGAVQPEEALS
jgi:predicted DNA-binding WGR domain protein